MHLIFIKATSSISGGRDHGIRDLSCTQDTTTVSFVFTQYGNMSVFKGGETEFRK